MSITNSVTTIYNATSVVATTITQLEISITSSTIVSTAASSFASQSPDNKTIDTTTVPVTNTILTSEVINWTVSAVINAVNWVNTNVTISATGLSKQIDSLFFYKMFALIES
jgi:hypothetical protein